MRNHEPATSTVDGNRHASVLRLPNQQVKNAAAANTKPVSTSESITPKESAPRPMSSKQYRTSISDAVNRSNAPQETTRRQNGTNPKRTRLSKNDANHAEKSRTIASARTSSSIRRND